MDNAIRIIGDVHGHIAEYKALIKDCPSSIQLGDMGFKINYDELKDVDSTRHRFIPANHDDYDALPPHALPGNYGILPLLSHKAFWYRGAYSIDQRMRILGIDYWANEEVDVVSAQYAIDCYSDYKPDIVLSHDAPTQIVEKFNYQSFKPSRTNRALQALYEAHAPMLWLFGHHHRTAWVQMEYSTLFICLGELDYFDLREGENGGIILDRKWTEGYLPLTKKWR